MSIKIYWGPGGSYKTSSAVWDDLPDFAFNGRKVVTNVRGLSDEKKVREVLEREFKKPVPDAFRLIHVESESREGKQKWFKWFHWMPNGAGVIVDEGQRIWPKKLTNAEIKLLDYPGGPDQAAKDDRPEGFDVSFDMHRHQNWDLVVTTTNIRNLHPQLRGNADGAIRHRNRALDGLKGSFNRAYHHPENEAKADRDVENQEVGLKVPAWVFELYKSTKTGIFTDTRSGMPWWKDKRFRALGAFLVFSIILTGSLLPRMINRYSNMGEEESKGEVVTTGAVKQSEANKTLGFPSISGLNAATIFYTGSINAFGVQNTLFLMKDADEKTGTTVTERMLVKMGYTVSKIAHNVYLLEGGNNKILVKRKGRMNENKIF